MTKQALQKSVCQLEHPYKLLLDEIPNINSWYIIVPIPLPVDSTLHMLLEIFSLQNFDPKLSVKFVLLFKVVDPFLEN